MITWKMKQKNPLSDDPSCPRTASSSSFSSGGGVLKPRREREQEERARFDDASKTQTTRIISSCSCSLHRTDVLLLREFRQVATRAQRTKACPGTNGERKTNSAITSLSENVKGGHEECARGAKQQRSSDLYD